MADVYSLLNEAEGFFSQRQYDQAIEKLQQVLQQDPTSEEACERLAHCFAVRGLLTQVVNQYFMLMDILESKGELELAVEVASWILKLQPENDKARMRVILIHRRRGDTAETIRQSLALARVYMELGQGDQSILLLQEVAQSDPNNLDVGMELAEMYISQGHIQEGAMQFGKIANMLLEQGQLEKAAEAFRRMKLVTAEDPSLSFTLGNIYVSLGKLNEAEAEFRSILRHNLNHLDALTALGQVCQQKGQFRDAILAFNKILTIDPQQVIAKEKLGELYQAQGNLNDSMKQFLAAGQQYQTEGDTARAVYLYQRVIGIDPSNPTASQQLNALGAPVVPADSESEPSRAPTLKSSMGGPPPPAPQPSPMPPREAAVPVVAAPIPPMEMAPSYGAPAPDYGQGYGAPPPPPGADYGQGYAPPAPGADYGQGYGTPPAPGADYGRGYGAPPPPGADYGQGYGAPPPPGVDYAQGYGAPPPDYGQGYGNPPGAYGQGYGAAPPADFSQGYGPPPSGDYGQGFAAPPPPDYGQGGFSAPPPVDFGQSFGGPPPPPPGADYGQGYQPPGDYGQGYGAPPPADFGQGFGAPPPPDFGGYGAPPPPPGMDYSQGYGAPPPPDYGQGYGAPPPATPAYGSPPVADYAQSYGAPPPPETPPAWGGFEQPADGGPPPAADAAPAAYNWGAEETREDDESQTRPSRPNLVRKGDSAFSPKSGLMKPRSSEAGLVPKGAGGKLGPSKMTRGEAAAPRAGLLKRGGGAEGSAKPAMGDRSGGAEVQEEAEPPRSKVVPLLRAQPLMGQPSETEMAQPPTAPPPEWGAPAVDFGAPGGFGSPPPPPVLDFGSPGAPPPPPMGFGPPPVMEFGAPPPPPLLDFGIPPPDLDFGTPPPAPSMELGLGQPPLDFGAPPPAPAIDFTAPPPPFETSEGEFAAEAPPPQTPKKPVGKAKATRRLEVEGDPFAGLFGNLEGPPPMDQAAVEAESLNASSSAPPALPPAEQLVTAAETVSAAASPDTAVDVARLQEYIQGHDLSRAFAAFQKGLESSPSNRELRQNLAQVYFQNGMLEEALAEFETLVQADPQNLAYKKQLAEAALWSTDQNLAVKGLLDYALALQKEGQYDEALAVLEDCIALDQDAAPARLALADIHNLLNMRELALYHLNTLADMAMQKEDAQAAIGTFRRLAEMTGDPSYQQRLAEALLKFGSQEEAREELRQMGRRSQQAGDMEQALLYFERLLAATPDDVEALELVGDVWRGKGDTGERYQALRFSLGSIYQEKGDMDRARAAFEELLSLNRSRTDVRKRLVEIYLDADHLENAMQEMQPLLEAAIKSRQYGDAIDLLGRLVEKAPENLMLREHLINFYEWNKDLERALSERIALGRAYTDRGQVEEAIRAFEKARKIDENNPDLFYALGCLYADKKNDATAAEAYFQKVYELNPSHAEAMRRLVQLLLSREQAAEAVLVLNKLIEVAPENQSLRDQIVQDYERKLAATPDDVQTRYTLGVMHLEMGNLDKAIPEFQKTRPFEAFTVKSYNMLGVAFLRKPSRNNEDLAMKQFLKGLEVKGRPDEEYLEIHYNLGKILDGKNKLSEAMEHYKEIITVDMGYRNGDVAKRLAQINQELSSDNVRRLPPRNTGEGGA